MKTVAAAKFKEQCLAMLDRLTPDGIVITKRGKPVAKVIPYRRSSGALIGALRDKIHVHGDLLSTGLKWDADASR